MERERNRKKGEGKKCGINICAGEEACCFCLFANVLN